MISTLKPKMLIESGSIEVKWDLSLDGLVNLVTAMSLMKTVP